MSSYLDYHGGHLALEVRVREEDVDMRELVKRMAITTYAHGTLCTFQVTFPRLGGCRDRNMILLDPPAHTSRKVGLESLRATLPDWCVDGGVYCSWPGRLLMQGPTRLVAGAEVEAWRYRRTTVDGLVRVRSTGWH